MVGHIYVMSILSLLWYFFDVGALHLLLSFAICSLYSFTIKPYSLIRLYSFTIKLYSLIRSSLDK